MRRSNGCGQGACVCGEEGPPHHHSAPLELAWVWVPLPLAASVGVPELAVFFFYGCARAAALRARVKAASMMRE